MSETNNKLEIKNLSKRFGEKILFENLSLTVDGPAVLWAPSGWGKTTLLRILMGLEAPDSGTVQGVGRVGAVFQEDRLCPQLTALENVLLAAGRRRETQARDILARCGEVPVYTAPLDVLKQLTGFPLTRGMLCAMRRRPLPAAETVCAGAKRVAVLEDVMNPTNVGAIFRSAAALGIDAVLLTQACSDPLYRRAIRVSMGTVFQVPWTYLPEGWPQTLRALGFTTAAMALCDASLPIYAPQLKRADRLAVVLGTEGDGLAESTIAACDCTVRIPMTHGVDSLNVAAASAVAFYQLALLAGLSEMED